MLISEKNKSIDFNVVGYEFPYERSTDYDANWLNIKIAHNDGKEEKTYTDNCSLTYELSGLIDAFQKIIDGEDNGYISSFMEPFLSICITNVDEYIIFVLSFVYDASEDEMPKISITAKWTRLEAEEKLKELKDMERKFPQR